MEQIEFLNALKQLSKKAEIQGNSLSKEEVQAFFGDFSLQEEQLSLVYDYLSAQKIRVLGHEPGANQEGQKDGNEESPNKESPKEEAASYTREELHFLQSYQRDLRAFAQMEAEALEELLQRVEQGDALAKSQATEQFLSHVLEQAKDLHGRGLPLEDLVQEGNVGLMLCLETLGLREDGIPAVRYVQQEIRQAMEEALEEDVNVRQKGNEIADRVNRLSDSIQLLTEEMERQVTPEELSAFLDMSVEEIQDILKLAGDGVELADGKGTPPKIL
ncbi:MAG: hypothetical protein HFI31_03525 [Lachnospiraceae bacterium]|nr:hypothetical protein [Lachnospiraceae bacterium]